MNLNLNELLADLVREKSFYACVLGSMQKVESTEMSRMAIGLKQGRLVLYYNPNYLRETFYANAVVSLNHETIHGVLDHIPRYLERLSQAVTEQERSDVKRVFNVAADCDVNCLLRKDETLWSKVLNVKRPTPERVEQELREKGIEISLLPDMPLEYYIEKLLPVSEHLPDPSAGDHLFWIPGEGGDGEATMSAEQLEGLAHLVRQTTKRMLKRAKSDFDKSHGLMPAGMQEWLDQFLAVPRVEWTTILSGIIASHRQAKAHRSIQRSNRALSAMAEEEASICPAIGKTIDNSYRIFYYEDHSGSMDEEARVKLRQEFQSLLSADDDVEVRLFMGDSLTAYDRTFQSGDEITWESHGRGGTDFNAYFKYMGQFVEDDATAPDLVIVGTDGECSPLDPELYLPPEFPVLWLLTENNHYWRRNIEESGYGEVLHID